ncbi:MAG TPA: spore cortex-lytic enzyme [Bacillales bacterium]|nr:spore cortex-lytic enzyme [Bacillales bacterium]
MLKRVAIAAMVLLISGIGVASVAPLNKAEAAAPVLNQGDHYGYVWGLQERLQQLGLYKGKVDGLFGPLTRQAVVDFQKQNGLTVDGKVGPNTLKKLRSETYSSHQIQLLAQLVYAESRGEPFKGQVAVAAVVLNRIDSQKFPDSVAGVIYQPHAFTCVQFGTFYDQPDKEAYRAVYEAIQGWDPSHHSLYYFNPVKATSDWIWSRTETLQIGHHIFAK